MPQPRSGFRTVQNVALAQEGEVGEMLLYGMIGQTGNWWSEEDDAITDLAILRSLNELVAEGCTRINVRINSPGGYVFDGTAIVNALSRCTAEIHTFNDGMAASMAAEIWAAGNVRHMADNALLMFHSASDIVWGNAREMRSQADVLEKMDSALAGTVAAACGKTKAAVVAELFDGADHWMTYEDAVEYGFKIGGDSYEAVVIDLATARANRVQMQATFKSQRAAAMASGPRIGAAAHLTAPTLNNSTTVNLDEFKAALADGSISVQEAEAAVSEQAATTSSDTSTETEVVVTPPVTEPAALDLTSVQALIDQQAAAIAQLTAQVQALGKLPGDAPSHLPGPGGVQQQSTDVVVNDPLLAYNQLLSANPSGSAFQHA